MSEISNASLMGVFPSVLARDSLFAPLGEAEAGELGKGYSSVVKAEIYTRILELDEPLLDQLARDFGIVWYEYDRPLDVKREVIAAAFSTMRILGTPGGMKLAINAVYDDAIVEEWYTYGGDPYHFRVVVTNEYDAAEDARMRKLIGIFKNVRSVLDSVDYSSVQSDSELIFGTIPAGAEVVIHSTTV